MWNVILSRLDGHHILPSENNPAKSGVYVCTCIRFFHGEEISRYIQRMEYNAEKDYWHDVGHPNAISHNIIAWTGADLVCDFNDFEYHQGYFFKKGQY